MKTKREYALLLAAKGFFVFHLIKNGKTPRYPGWQNEATNDPDKIKKMWSGRNAECNIGIYTGKFGKDGKGFIGVLDQDDKPEKGKDGARSISYLDYQGFVLSKTLTQTTASGGKHYIYSSDLPMRGDIGKLGNEKLNGIDFKSKGGYIVGAGSTVDKKIYTIDETPIAKIPPWLYERQSLTNRVKPKKLTAPVEINQENALARARKYIDEWAPSAEDGTRNATAYKVACRIKDFGLNEDGCLQLMYEWNERLENPMEEDEVERVTASAYKTGQNDIGVAAPEVLFAHGDETVKRLAALPPLEYDRVRKDEAEKLQCRTETLDKEVTKARQSCAEDQGVMAAMFPDIEPWPQPVNGAELLNDIYATIKRFIVCDDETARAATLWIVFTWFIDRLQVAPLAIITAPEKRCGKSQLLDLIGKLSCRPLVASNISSAAIFRVVEAHKPTLLIDEADSFLRENEEARGIINSGHTRQTAFVIRVVGEDHVPTQFKTWGAKVICGIGTMPETLMDRAVVLELRRKLPYESVERLRHADPEHFKTLISKLARFAEDAGDAIERARPVLPDNLNDRAQDNWEPLLAIADHAGEAWPEKARKTALRLSGTAQETISSSAELLADIRDIFDEKKCDRITTKALLDALTSDNEKPWLTHNRGKPMSPRQLAKKLDGYGIKPQNLNMGGNARPKGYDRKAFEDVFTRYLSSPADTSENAATSLLNAEMPANSIFSEVADCAQQCSNKSPSATDNPLKILNSSGVADKSGDTGQAEGHINPKSFLDDCEAFS